jgi:hypothetical protein
MPRLVKTVIHAWVRLMETSPDSAEFNLVVRFRVSVVPDEFNQLSSRKPFVSVLCGDASAVARELL